MNAQTSLFFVKDMKFPAKNYVSVLQELIITIRNQLTSLNNYFTKSGIFCIDSLYGTSCPMHFCLWSVFPFSSHPVLRSALSPASGISLPVVPDHCTSYSDVLNLLLISDIFALIPLQETHLFSQHGSYRSALSE